MKYPFTYKELCINYITTKMLTICFYYFLNNFLLFLRNCFALLLYISIYISFVIFIKWPLIIAPMTSTIPTHMSTRESTSLTLTVQFTIRWSREGGAGSLRNVTGLSQSFSASNPSQWDQRVIPSHCCTWWDVHMRGTYKN